MLNEKIEYIIHELGCDLKTVGKYSGITSSGLSRLKSGSRSYSPKSHTVQRFIDGVYGYAADNSKVGTLCMIVGTSAATEMEIKRALTHWLFDEKKAPPPSMSNVSGEGFGKKIRQLMELADVSNSRLSRDMNIDSSYISRIKTGTRIPRRNPELMMSLCENVCARIYENGRQEKLAELIDMPVDYLSSSDSARQVFGWLYDHSMTANIQAVKTLVEHIETYSDMEIYKPYDYDISEDDDIINEQMTLYEGTEGLKRATIRFIVSAIKEGSKQICLYNDLGLEWLTGEFLEKWEVLIRECIKKGIKIRIIHNVDRSPFEMIAAINAWLPLYMHDLIEPYYCTKKQGERFNHIILVDPGRACIAGHCVNGLSDIADFEYVTEEKRLNKLTAVFDKLLSYSEPLVMRSSGDAFINEKFSVYSVGHIQICTGTTKVVVNKLSEPTTNLLMSNSMLCAAFNEYVQTVLSGK